MKILLTKNHIAAYRIQPRSYFEIEIETIMVLMDQNNPAVRKLLTDFDDHESKSIEILWVPKIFGFVWTLARLVHPESGFVSEI